MNILLVHPGASFSTHDVFVGYADALVEAGHIVYPYRLDAAIDDMTTFAKWKARRGSPMMSQPQRFWEAGTRAIISALYKDVDWVIVISAMYLHPDVLIMMRRAGLRVALLLTESPYDDIPQQEVARHADVACTNERTSVERLRRHNPNTHYLPHAYNPALHYPDNPAPGVPRHDVVFVGTLFEERIETLAAVDWTGIDLGLYGSHALLGSRSKLRRYVAGDVVDNRHAADLYRAAKIGLNLYRTSVGFGRGVPKVGQAESLNLRAYELAACGVFQFSDHRAEMLEMFGNDVVMFGDPPHLADLIHGYLSEPRARRQFAEATRRVVQPHTYAARAGRLLAILERSVARAA